MTRAFADSMLVHVDSPAAFEPALRRFMKGVGRVGCSAKLRSANRICRRVSAGARRRKRLRPGGPKRRSVADQTTSSGNRSGADRGGDHGQTDDGQRVQRADPGHAARHQGGADGRLPTRGRPPRGSPRAVHLVAAPHTASSLHGARAQGGLTTNGRLQVART